jgi:hypothetical protein
MTHGAQDGAARRLPEVGGRGLDAATATPVEATR